MSFWKPNVTGAGRIFRLLCGIALLVAAYLTHDAGMKVWPWICGIAGLVGLYEGLRGWCLLRACRIKLPF